MGLSQCNKDPRHLASGDGSFFEDAAVLPLAVFATAILRTALQHSPECIARNWVSRIWFPSSKHSTPLEIAYSVLYWKLVRWFCKASEISNGASPIAPARSGFVV